MGLKWDIKNVMERYVGIERSREGLNKAKNKIINIINRLEKHSVKNSNYKELENMALVSNLIIDRCLYNETSKGCHYRID